MRQGLPALVLSGLMTMPLAAQAPGPVRPAVGQEWTYRATVVGRERGEPTGASAFDYKVATTATLVGKRGSEWEVVRYEKGAARPPMGPPMAVTRVWVATSAADYPTSDDVPPIALAPTLVGLPVAFTAIPKPGEEAREQFRLLGYPGLVQLNAIRRVTGSERIGARECLVVERQLADPLPVKIPEGPLFAVIEGFSEKLWIEAATGVLVRYEGRMIAKLGADGGEQTVEIEFRLALAGVKRLPPAETRTRRQHALTLQTTERQIAQLADAPDRAAATARLRTRLRDFQRRYPNSPYREVARRQLAALQEEQPPPARRVANLLGKPAPELRLKDLEGKERTLADFRGKIVILNFFASW